MDIKYISGFFDADGCIHLTGQSKLYGFKSSLKIVFTNTNKYPLEQIQNYLLTKHNIKSSLITSQDYRPNRAKRYDLIISCKDSVKLCKLLQSYHTVKNFKIQVVNKFYNQIIAGKRKVLNEKDVLKRKAFQRLFHWKK